ncbi:riboflavin synthase [Anthocerotibacter panamensis]|uniref:riboflavin synthase n=1 Tax=Anthocerotibacter panamensis TaxID=2857077 RepID=UPI001C407FA0|nr:riboflavin synthase [Anthocerotibacter panamensis]
MFTGLIEEVGHVEIVRTERLTIRARKVLEEVALGDSIAVDGVCLTVIQYQGDRFTAQVSDETLSRTNLGERAAGSLVNLERSLRLGGKVGGHFVSGHIDGTGFLEARTEQGEFVEMTFWAPVSVRRFLAPKGSIAVNGVSLTIARATEQTFTVAVIPFSLQETNLIALQPGEPVNLEGDILAKYVARMVDTSAGNSPEPHIDSAFLAEHGFI